MTSRNWAIVAACMGMVVAPLQLPANAIAAPDPRRDPAGSPEGGGADVSVQNLARALLQSDAARHLSVTGRNALELIVGRGRGDDEGRRARSVPAVRDEILDPRNVRVNDPATDPDADLDITTQSETAVAAFGSTVLVGYNDSGNYLTTQSFMGYGRSTDGGASFTDMGPMPVVVPDGFNFGDPALVADRRGRFYTAFIAENVSLPPDISIRVGVQRSVDGGATWSAPTYVPPFLPGSFTDKEFLAVDNSPGPAAGNVYVTWTNFGPSNDLPIVFSRSTNGGATFSAPIQISAPGSVNQGSEPVVGPHGEIFVAWEQLYAFTGAHQGTGIVVARSTNGGLTFEPPVFVADVAEIGFGSGNLAGNFRTNAFPRIDVNPVTGDVDLVFVSNPTGPDAADVFFTRSTDGGAHWAPALRVNDDHGAADQWFPDLAVNAQGQIRVFWYDRRRHSENPGDLLVDVYGAGSTDGGVSFGPNERINHSLSGPDNGMLPAVGFDPLVNPIYMGDYNDLKAEITPDGVGSGFVSAWGDFRRIVSSEGGTRSDQDVVFARQDFGTAPVVQEPAAGMASRLAPQGAVITFDVAGEAGRPVEIGIFDVTGRLVARLAGGVQGPGRHEMLWDGRGGDGRRMDSGMYFARPLQGGPALTCSDRVLILR
jgi:flagellar hook capping protein FlgD